MAAYTTWATVQLSSLAYDGLVAYRRVGGRRRRHDRRRARHQRSHTKPRRPDVRLHASPRAALLRRHARPAGGLPHVDGAHVRAAGTGLPVVLHGDRRARRSARAGRPGATSREGIETDARARTITIHLTRPDGEFMHKLTCPYAYVVPTGARRAPPSTAAARHRALPRRARGNKARRDYRPQPALPPRRRRGRRVSRTGSRSRVRRDTTVSGRSRRSSAGTPISWSSPIRSAATSRRPACARCSPRPRPAAHRSGPETDWVFLNVRRRPFDASASGARSTSPSIVPVSSRSPAGRWSAGPRARSCRRPFPAMSRIAPSARARRTWRARGAW